MKPTFIPSALTSPDIDRFAKWLSLSDEQKRLLAEACKTYEAAWEAVRTTEVPSLLRLAEEAALADPVTPQNVSVIDDLVKRNVELQERLEAVDRAFFVELESMLAEPQLPTMARVRLDRDRTRSAIRTALIPAAGIDLTRLVDAARVEPDPARLDEFEALVQEYELAVTPLMTRLAQTVVMQTARLAHVEISRTHDESGMRLDPRSPEGKTRSERGRADRTRVISESGDLQQQVAETNAKFVARLAECLTPDSRSRMFQAYHDRAFPIVYPDPLEPTPLYQAMRSSDLIDDSERALLDAHWKQYQLRYNQLTKTMVERFSQWRLGMARTQSSMPAEYIAYRDQMRGMRDERWIADAEVVEQMFRALSGPAQEALKPAVEQHRAKVRELQNRAQKDQYPSP
jgi:hypothetical protein